MGFFLLPGPAWLRFSQPVRVYPVTSIGARAAAIITRTFAFYPLQLTKLLLYISGDTTKRPISNSCVTATIRSSTATTTVAVTAIHLRVVPPVSLLPYKFTTNQRQRGSIASPSRCVSMPHFSFGIQSSTPSLLYA